MGNPIEDNLSLEDFAVTISVDDLTISWSVGGWYQVQNAETLHEVCNGVPECVVEEPGTYLVINHSIGRRVEVSVGQDSPTDPGTETPPTESSFSSSLTVNDNTISWSMAGWHQVLDATTYSHVCGGGSSCTVPEEGRYIVINHDADLRAELYVGSGTDASNYPDGVTVSGNVISLPDDGWYQVQSSTSYESICEGTITCQADQPGRYTIINHTSGERFEDIAVYWSKWLDRDNPSGAGDWEIGFEEGLPCADPMDIQARVLGQNQIYSIGDSMPNLLTTFQAAHGLVCENEKQTFGNCEDYEIRFYCPYQ
ncbi:hypothetical protein [Granulosicoccus antarcticus]|uniref:hypothetical protein n=1 Tax=Granulosicoccus antarcticus TaxID=437505 RepID=UPI0012FD43CB|nr:hypothetical protein [Granulosicoccus antarcticus]